MLSQDNELIALVAEGSAERAILEVLMDHNGLIYKRMIYSNKKLLGVGMEKDLL